MTRTKDTPSMQSILRAMKAAAKSSPKDGRAWYVWVSRSGYVSLQDGEPTNTDGYASYPSAIALYGLDRLDPLALAELRQFLGL